MTPRKKRARPRKKTPADAGNVVSIEINRGPARADVLKLIEEINRSVRGSARIVVVP